MSAAKTKLYSEPFSKVDAAWLHMENPTSMAMITGVMMFDAPLDVERLKNTFEYRLVANYPRFRQRVRESARPFSLPRWENDPHFSPDAHIHRVALPSPGDQQALQDLVGDLMSMPLDFSKPLWQLHVVENFNGGTALVIRLHHCVADGLALMQVLLSTTDETPDMPWPEPPSRNHSRLSPLARLFLPAVSVARSAKRTLKEGVRLVQAGCETLTNPEKLSAAAGLGVSATLSLGKILLIGPDQKTIFKGECTVNKKAAWSKPLPLKMIKETGQMMGGTVNDILLAAVSGALRRYLEAEDQPTEGVNIRALVPVNLRQPEEALQLGNRFGLVFLSLPIGIKDPLKRLKVLKRRMDAIKDTPEAVVGFGILNLMGMTPAQVEKKVIEIFGMKATAVMTNVPGPRQKLYLAGQPVRGMMFWVPSPAQLGLGVSIISMAGEVIVGVATDACLVPNPQAIVRAFEDELDQLHRWGRSRLAEVAAVQAAEPEADGDEVEVIEVTLTGEATPAGLQVTGVELTETLAAPLPPIPAGQCQGLTRSGAPCKNKALPGSNFCRVHRS